MNSRTVSATEFKAKCLALLDEVGHKGGTITVTKRGQPLATVGPFVRRSWRSPESSWSGRVQIPDERLVAERSDLWGVLARK